MVNFLGNLHLLKKKIAEKDNQSLHNDNNHLRALIDHMNSTRINAPLCIVFPLDASHFNFKSGIIQFSPNFYGLDLENPYLHLREFKEICNKYNDLNCSMNTIRLKFFHFSLTWLQNLKSRYIHVQDEMQQKILKKFFPSQ